MARFRLSNFLYRAARTSRDLEAVESSVEQGSLAPVGRRVANRLIGKGLAFLARGLWVR